MPTDGTKVQVTDLGSTNGTYLDEDELPTNRGADVYIGSRITFGKLVTDSGSESLKKVCIALVKPCTDHRANAARESDFGPPSSGALRLKACPV